MTKKVLDLTKQELNAATMSELIGGTTSKTRTKTRTKTKSN